MSAHDFKRWPEKSPYIRRTLAAPNLATSSKSPAAMRGDVLSASMRIANRRVRLSSGMFGPPLFVPERGHQYTSAVFGLSERASRSGLWKLRDWQINSAIVWFCRLEWQLTMPESC